MEAVEEAREGTVTQVLDVMESLRACSGRVKTASLVGLA